MTITVSQHVWWKVAQEVIVKYAKQGAKPYTSGPGIDLNSYRSRAVISLNWATLQEAVGETMQANNTSFTVQELRGLGLDDPKLVRFSVCTIVP